MERRVVGRAQILGHPLLPRHGPAGRMEDVVHG